MVGAHGSGRAVASLRGDREDAVCEDLVVAVPVHGQLHTYIREVYGTELVSFANLLRIIYI